jgi:hypothetical protein
VAKLFASQGTPSPLSRLSWYPGGATGFRTLRASLQARDRHPHARAALRHLPNIPAVFLSRRSYRLRALLTRCSTILIATRAALARRAFSLRDARQGSRYAVDLGSEHMVDDFADPQYVTDLIGCLPAGWRYGPICAAVSLALE